MIDSMSRASRSEATISQLASTCAIGSPAIEPDTSTTSATASGARSASSALPLGSTRIDAHNVDFPAEMLARSQRASTPNGALIAVQHVHRDLFAPPQFFWR